MEPETRDITGDQLTSQTGVSSNFICCTVNTGYFSNTSLITAQCQGGKTLIHIDDASS